MTATRKIDILDTVSISATRTTTYKLMTVIISDFVLYSMLKVPNVSLTIIFRGTYSYTYSLAQILKINESKDIC